MPDRSIQDWYGRGASKWDKKEALLSRAEVAGTQSTKGRTTKVTKAGKGPAYLTDLCCP